MATECQSCGSATDAAVCHREGVRLAGRLREAADLWPELDVALARLARLGDPTPRAGRPAPPEPVRPDGGELRHYADQTIGWASGLPFSEPASEAIWVVRNTVTTWAREVAQATGADLPTGTDALMRWLAGRVDWARHQPWALECLDELDAACALVFHAVDRRPLRTRFVVGPCPEIVESGWCEGRVWAVVPAVETRPASMVCDGCHARWDTTQWRRVGRRIEARAREAV